eukprot:6182267-Pleurochrysis_carterae.AAC.1
MSKRAVQGRIGGIISRRTRRGAAATLLCAATARLRMGPAAPSPASDKSVERGGRRRCALEPMVADDRSASRESPQVSHEQTPSACLPSALAISLPPGWPTPLLPCGIVLGCVPPDIATHCEIHHSNDHTAGSPETLSAPRVPAQVDGAAASISGNEDCFCGVKDHSKFMLACDSCDSWFHGV